MWKKHCKFPSAAPGVASNPLTLALLYTVKVHGKSREERAREKEEKRLKKEREKEAKKKEKEAKKKGGEGDSLAPPPPPSPTPSVASSIASAYSEDPLETDPLVADGEVSNDSARGHGVSSPGRSYHPVDDLFKLVFSFDFIGKIVCDVWGRCFSHLMKSSAFI